MFSTRSRLEPPELRQAMVMSERRVVSGGQVWKVGAAARRLVVVVMLQRRESGRVPRISGTSSLRFASVGIYNGCAERNGRGETVGCGCSVGLLMDGNCG
jgi:hypothetical protein